MAIFETQNGNLLIDGKKVLKGWESFSGCYWFGIEVDHTQDSVISFDPEVVVMDDKIWFGFVQGLEEEWGYFSQWEIEALGKMKVWEIPKANLPISGRR